MPEQNDLEAAHEINMRKEIAAQRAIRTGLEEEYLGASNGIAGAKRPLAPEDRQYPEHDKLIEHIMDLVAGNIEAGRDCMHAREMLDDILVDLTYLKNAIGTADQYHEKGLL
tara:strand:- start:1654 stop:1989 length:336 start_codon:yes stop_codon:yes gene_type:complete